VEESDDDDEEPKSELQLMYNTVRGYVSAIMKLYNHQISMRLHSSPSPHNVAIKAMKTSISRGQHQRRRAELLPSTNLLARRSGVEGVGTTTR